MGNPAWLKPKEDNNERMTALPVGTYKAKVLGVKKEEKRFIFQVDIAEGEFTDYYKKDYESRKGGKYEAKYKGVYTLWIPTGDGSQNDEFSTNKFCATVYALEESNLGFKFDFDNPASCKGKVVGIRVREHMWVYDGKKGISTEIGAFTKTDKIGKVEAMKPRVDKGYNDDAPEQPVKVTASSSFMEVDDEPLPF